MELSGRYYVRKLSEKIPLIVQCYYSFKVSGFKLGESKCQQQIQN